MSGLLMPSNKTTLGGIRKRRRRQAAGVVASARQRRRQAIKKVDEVAKLGDIPLICQGEKFECYSVPKHGSIQREWRNADGRLRIGRNVEGGTSWYAEVNGRVIAAESGRPRRFQSLSAAMHAAVDVGRHV